MPKIKTKCKKCGKEIEVFKSQIENGRGKFCSRKCSSSYNNSGDKNPMYGKKHKTETIEKIKKTRKKQGNYNKGKTWKISEEKRKNMARNTWEGRGNPAWIDGRARSRGYIWKNWNETLKRSIRERDNYVCQLCSSIQGEKTFSVHHIDYNKHNCDHENLITLCNSCHSKTNFNRNRWKKYFQERHLIII